jgi:hypothetical protein
MAMPPRAMVAMHLTGTFHPPAGIDPLVVVVNHMFQSASSRLERSTTDDKYAAKASAYRSERSRGWVKKKSPDASAATREAEEAWS